MGTNRHIENTALAGKTGHKVHLRLKPIEWDNLSSDLQNIIATSGGGGGSGIGLTGDFGDSTILGIHQKALTEKFKEVEESFDFTKYIEDPSTADDVWNEVSESPEEENVES